MDRRKKNCLISDCRCINGTNTNLTDRHSIGELCQPRCLALRSRWSSSSSRSRSKGGAGTSKQSEGEKSGKEPKKPFEVPKTSGASAESKPPPPPPPEQPFDNSKYRVQELYQHGPMSFYDIECSLSPLRCPVPSSVKKPA